MLQYSVYLCDLTPIEKFGLMGAVHETPLTRHYPEPV